MSSVDSTVPPIVSPTGELIQPGPLSYQQNTSGTHALNALLKYHGNGYPSAHTGRVTSHTPDLNEPSTSSVLGSSGQTLQPNSKTYADDFQSSGPVFRKVGNNKSGSI